MVTRETALSWWTQLETPGYATGDNDENWTKSTRDLKV